MAAESEENFKQFLPDDFPTQIKQIELDSDNATVTSFVLEVMCKSEDFTKWLKGFERNTKTNYKVTKETSTGHKFEKTMYAVCRHSTCVRSKNPKRGTKNTGCLSKIQMKKQRPLVYGTETTTHIFVNFRHNHPILESENLQSRPPSKETKQKFLKLFRKGHNLVTAIQANNLEIVLENPDDHELLLSDNSVSPNYAWASRLYKKEFGSSYWNRDLNDKEQINLIVQNAEGKDCCCKVIEYEDQFAIIILTNMMKRVSQMAESGEICYIDSNTGKDSLCFIFLSKLSAVAVPWAVVLATSENQILLSFAFQYLKELLPSEAFGQRSKLLGPMVFMTNNNTIVNCALRSTWPKAVFFLCAFKVLKEIWERLCNKQRNISLEDSIHIYELFKQVLYADTEETFMLNYHKFIYDGVVSKYERIKNYVKSLFNQKEGWALCYRQQHFFDDSMTVMKDYVLEKAKSYNIIQLADFVLSRLDTYYEQKILSIAFNRLNWHFTDKQTYLKCNVDFAKNKILEVADSIYLVPSEKDSAKAYIVNNNVCSCDCFHGRDGQLCIHQVAVLDNGVKKNFMLLNDMQVQQLYYIATGNAIEIQSDEQSDECITLYSFDPSEQVDEGNENELAVLPELI